MGMCQVGWGMWEILTIFLVLLWLEPFIREVER